MIGWRLVNEIEASGNQVQVAEASVRKRLVGGCKAVEVDGVGGGESGKRTVQSDNYKALYG